MFPLARTAHTTAAILQHLVHTRGILLTAVPLCSLTNGAREYLRSNVGYLRSQSCYYIRKQEWQRVSRNCAAIQPAACSSCSYPEHARYLGQDPTEGGPVDWGDGAHRLQRDVPEEKTQCMTVCVSLVAY